MVIDSGSTFGLPGGVARSRSLSIQRTQRPCTSASPYPPIKHNITLQWWQINYGGCECELTWWRLLLRTAGARAVADLVVRICLAACGRQSSASEPS